MVSGSLPAHFLGAILEPIGQCHIRVREVHRIHASGLGRHRVLLRKNQTHDLAQLNVLQEELHMDRVGRVSGRGVELIFDEVVLRHHFNVGVVGVDPDRSSQCHCHGAVSREERPPDSLPEPLVGLAELRRFHATRELDNSEKASTTHDAYLRCMPEP